MILRSFSLLDIKAGFYSPPFFMSHLAQAVRAVGELGEDLRTQVGRHPADYQLVELGTWDDQTGAYENHQVPRPVGLVANLLREDRQAPLALDRVSGGPI
jgi:hypothetical protein